MHDVHPKVEKFFNYLAMVLIIVMMIVVVTDVIGLYIANMPFPAAVELSEFFMVAIVYGDLAYTQFIKGHISINLLTERYNRKRKLIAEIVSLLIGLFFFAILTWQAINMTWISWQIREIVFTAAFPLPVYPVKAMVIIGSFLICIRFMAQIIINLKSLFERF